MTAEELIAEAMLKPSGVAFRKLSSTVYVTVKLYHDPKSSTGISCTWKCGSQVITQTRADELLKNII